MTALVALERLEPKTEIEVSRQAYETYGDSGYFRTGDKLPLEIMLYPLLLESSNDAAEAIAEKVGREKFIVEMNKKAKELGMEETFFEDPSGLSPNNVSSAGDLVRLADYIHQNKIFLFDITKLKEYQHGRFVWTNRNNLIGMNYYAGGKNGYTDEANRTLLALYDLPLSEFETRKIVLVLLGSDDRKSDTRNIVNYIAGNVSYSGPSVFKTLDDFGWDEI
jgi:D-alanyl-D-alanine carboxypeptidase